MTPLVALAAVAAWHAAFQLAVSTLAYPTLLEQPVDRFAAAHDRHSRRVLVLVVPTYAAVLGAVVWAVAAGPRTPAVLLAVALQGVVLLLTALLAAPTHGALGREGRTPALARRLRAVDAARSVTALAGLVAAVAALA
ncbi:hypothetical protein KMZ32_12880 [Phycicoccus sp. MAQZ13P-2]|uniref:hypothetical protein n=1 Tax=Phycicoccus mangrovi TaxID=2840470 RepID=UPI001C000DE5|nr:hypothetical protein [Phycicoccus mangrovi]MBT9256884.1 hypothetical protein [Phycicoccus mangrovi]MBT9274967.1 hypothetical protein [Phycicoccus mangrovi]